MKHGQDGKKKLFSWTECWKYDHVEQIVNLAKTFLLLTSLPLQHDSKERRVGGGGINSLGTTEELKSAGGGGGGETILSACGLDDGGRRAALFEDGLPLWHEDKSTMETVYRTAPEEPMDLLSLINLQLHRK